MDAVNTKGAIRLKPGSGPNLTNIKSWCVQAYFAHVTYLDLRHAREANVANSHATHHSSTRGLEPRLVPITSRVVREHVRSLSLRAAKSAVFIRSAISAAEQRNCAAKVMRLFQGSTPTGSMRFQYFLFQCDQGQSILGVLRGRKGREARATPVEVEVAGGPQQAGAVAHCIIIYSVLDAPEKPRRT